MPSVLKKFKVGGEAEGRFVLYIIFLLIFLGIGLNALLDEDLVRRMVLQTIPKSNKGVNPWQ